MNSQDYGKIAYRQWCRDVCRIQLPTPWEKLPPVLQHTWISIGHAIIRAWVSDEEENKKDTMV